MASELPPIPPLLPSVVQDGLTTGWAGRHIVHRDEVTSTQTVARELGPAGAPHGTLIIGEEQVAGRGREGRSFASPPGGIWSTLVIRAPIPATGAALLALAAGMAASIAIEAVAGIAPVLKWPNDLLIGRGKVAGILVETTLAGDTISEALIGTGINANTSLGDYPAGLASSITTLRDSLGHDVDRRSLLQRYLVEAERLIDLLAAGEPSAITMAWRSRPNILGMRVSVASEGAPAVVGTANALADDGALEIESGDGPATVHSGSLTLLD